MHTIGNDATVELAPAFTLLFHARAVRFLFAVREGTQLAYGASSTVKRVMARTVFNEFGKRSPRKAPFRWHLGRAVVPDAPMADTRWQPQHMIFAATRAFRTCLKRQQHWQHLQFSTAVAACMIPIVIEKFGFMAFTLICVVLDISGTVSTSFNSVCVFEKV